ncbi:MAG TPA: hypothetical protein PKO15_11560 [Fibrobacteria bacterium]|nr:hypothetical protein [Fibrobacteria bacterium]
MGPDLMKSILLVAALLLVVNVVSVIPLFVSIAWNSAKREDAEWWSSKGELFPRILMVRVAVSVLMFLLILLTGLSVFFANTLFVFLAFLPVFLCIEFVMPFFPGLRRKKDFLYYPSIFVGLFEGMLVISFLLQFLIVISASAFGQAPI